MNAQWREALAFSAKTALAALAALGVSLWVGLPMPFWAMTTAYIVSSPLSGATRSKAIYRVGGTAIGATVAVGLVPMLVDWPELLCLALALWMGSALTLSLLDRSPRAYVLMLSGYTAALIAFPAVDRPEAVFDIAVARVTEITLGITCATLAHSLFWPRSVADTLAPRLRQWLNDAETWHSDIRDGSSDSVNRNDRRQLAVDIVDCTLLATHVPFDTSHWREATASLQALLRRMLLLLPVLSGLADRRAAMTGRADAWSALLEESGRLRDGQARQLIRESGQLLRHLEDPREPSPLSPEERRRAITLHADPGFAALSGGAAALAVLLSCALWITTGWADGGTATALTAMFCCLFAAMDNPVPAILRFGLAIVGGIPLAAIYLFAILPSIDGFPALLAVLAPALLAIGSLMMHPRWGLSAMAMIVGFCSAMAIQESYEADFAHFLNSNLAQVVAVVISACMTAGLRTIGRDAAIARLDRRMQRELVTLALAESPPDPLAALGRTTDRLALITQRLGADTDMSTAGLRDVRLAMNIVNAQHMRARSSGALREALGAMLREVAAWFSRKQEQPDGYSRLLDAIDAALRASLAVPEAGEMPDLFFTGPEPGRSALVALRRNLFPDAAPFRPEAIA